MRCATRLDPLFCALTFRVDKFTHFKKNIHVEFLFFFKVDIQKNIFKNLSIRAIQDSIIFFAQKRYPM